MFVSVLRRARFLEAPFVDAVILFPCDQNRGIFGDYFRSVIKGERPTVSPKQAKSIKEGACMFERN